MDKLQPVIKHRFWILAALVPPLCIFGYYKANGALKAATTDRITTLDGVIGGIPPGDQANPTWTEGAQKLNETYKSAVDVELVRVWEEQQARMKWPRSMQRYVPAVYRDPFPDEAGFIYRDEYADLIAELHRSVEPITPDSGGGFSGKVWLDQKLIPRHAFGELSVASDRMWDAQEDLWYLQLILDAIRNVNRPAENAAKAPIRKVYKIELRGGTGESSVKASASGNSMISGNAAMEGMHGAMEMSSEAAGPRSGQGGFTSKVAFDPTEEFGSQTQAGQSSSNNSSGAADAMHMAAAPGATGGGRGELIRYIKEDENAKFLERGFYLSLLIDQKRIPDFLVELSNADWPIRIVRFHVGPNPEKPGSAGTMMDSYTGGYEGEVSAEGADLGYDAFDPAAFSDPTLMAEPMSDMQVGPSPLVTSEQMAGLFTHPDLVQLDVCGIITFYKEPVAEVLAAVEEASGAAPDAGAAEEAGTSEETASTVPAADAESTAEPSAAPDPGVSDAAAIPGAAPAEETEGAASETPVPVPDGDAPVESDPAPPATDDAGNDPGAVPAPEPTPATESTPAPE
jgi:hypothetical protein